MTDFHGAVYDPQYDHSRLVSQLGRVLYVMNDGKYRTLREIAYITGDGESSISAQLRNLKKPKHGGHTLTKRPRGDRLSGLWEYQILPNGHLPL